jgi:hypothetical protein
MSSLKKSFTKAYFCGAVILSAVMVDKLTSLKNWISFQDIREFSFSLSGAKKKYGFIFFTIIIYCEVDECRLQKLT